MTVTTYGFEEALTDGAYEPPSPPFAFQPLYGFGTEGALVAPSGIYDGLGGGYEHPARLEGVVLGVHAFTENEIASVTITGTWVAAGTIAFDLATHGDPDDVFAIQIDGETTAYYGPAEPWQARSYPIAAGEHTVRLVIERSATPMPDEEAYGYGFAIDNVAIDDGGGSEPPAPEGYRRGDWVKHLGGVYICRIDGATSEPGPGDSADWFEVSARPAPAYTPDPRNLPVRASATNPFEAGEAGLWIQLDGDGNVIGQVYEDGEA